MKTFLAAVALATLVASPAFSQSYDPDVGTGNITPPYDDPQVPWTVFSGNPGGAYAQYYPGDYSGYAQVSPFFGFGSSYAPAPPFAYYRGNYGSYAGYGTDAGYGAVDTGAYAQVPIHPRHRTHHTRSRRHHD
jgi:hypothetical protein